MDKLIVCHKCLKQISYSDNMQYVFCSKCGTRIDILQSNVIAKLLQLANQSVEYRDYKKAIAYCDRIFEKSDSINEITISALILKGCCSAYLHTLKSVNFDFLIKSTNKSMQQLIVIYGNNHSRMNYWINNIINGLHNISIYFYNIAINHYQKKYLSYTRTDIENIWKCLLECSKLNNFLLHISNRNAANYYNARLSILKHQVQCQSELSRKRSHVAQNQKTEIIKISNSKSYLRKDISDTWLYSLPIEIYQNSKKIYIRCIAEIRNYDNSYSPPKFYGYMKQGTATALGILSRFLE